MVIPATEERLPEIRSQPHVKVWRTWLLVALVVMLCGGYFSLFVFGRLAMGAANTLIFVSPLAVLVVQRRFRLPVAVAVAILWIAALIASTSVYIGFSGAVAVAGAKTLGLPLCAFLIGFNAIRLDDFIKLSTPIAVLAVINALFAIWQKVVGAEALISYGYSYGSTIRQFEGEVRSFGLMPRDNIFGQMTALLLVFAVWTLVQRDLHRRAFSSWMCVVASGTGLYMSSNRTAQGVALAGVLIVLLRTRGRMLERLGRPAVAALTAAGVFVLVSYTDLGSLASLQARFQEWSRLLALTNPWVGGGPAAAGVTATTALAGFQQTNSVGDNYYVTLLAQYGILGAIILIPLTVFCFKKISLLRHAAERSLTLALIVIMAFTALSDNIWEEFPTAPFAMLLLGSCLAKAETIA